MNGPNRKYAERERVPGMRALREEAGRSLMTNSETAFDKVCVERDLRERCRQHRPMGCWSYEDEVQS